MSSDWLRVDLLLSEISDSTGLFGVVCKTNKLAPQMFIHDKMLLSYLTQFCSLLMFIFFIIQTLDYLDYFIQSQQVRIIKVRLYCTPKDQNMHPRMNHKTSEAVQTVCRVSVFITINRYATDQMQGLGKDLVTAQLYETDRKSPFLDIPVIITNFYCHHNKMEPCLMITYLSRPLTKCPYILLETLLMQPPCPQFKILNSLQII